MIKTGRQKGFEIRNVVPDGNCMFAAVVDQLELLRDWYISPFALRQSCVQFLKSTPTSQDGTPFYLFLDGESWEDYLSRIGQEGQWGDHLMLQAISSVSQVSILCKLSHHHFIENLLVLAMIYLKKLVLNRNHSVTLSSIRCVKHCRQSNISLASL